MADTVLPRLLALGADTTHIFRVRQADHTWDPIGFPTHTAALDRLLAQTAARFVVIDPVMAFLDRSVRNPFFWSNAIAILIAGGLFLMFVHQEKEGLLWQSFTAKDWRSIFRSSARGASRQAGLAARSSSRY